MSKYNARRVVTEDGAFDNQREYKRWCELKLLEQVGQISNLQRQVRYELIPKMGRDRATYFVADFTYKNATGEFVVEDSKSYRNRLYLLKRKLMMRVHGISILET